MQLDLAKTRAALLTVVRVEGSSYRRTGARMLVQENGQWTGGISGGCLEGDALRRAQQAIARERPSLVTYDTTQEDGHEIGVGLGCNGIIDVLITPLAAHDAQNAVQLLQNSLEAKRQTTVLLTVMQTGTSTLPLGAVYRYTDAATLAQQLDWPWLAERIHNDVETRLHLGKSKPITYATEQGDLTVFVEILKPPMQLLLYGGNYDVYPLVHMAKELGWRVEVRTNPQKVRKSLFATADAVIDHRTGPLPAVDAYTAAILMSHDYATDLRHLQEVLATDIAYIGILGPRQRSDKMLAELAAAGYEGMADLHTRLYAPTGLDIGALTPEEIALAMLAEIRAVFSGRAGGSLRDREGPIH